MNTSQMYTFFGTPISIQLTLYLSIPLCFISSGSLNPPVAIISFLFEDSCSNSSKVSLLDTDSLYFPY